MNATSLGEAGLPGATAPPQADSSRRGWQAGLSQALPIVLGYLPIGVAFGVLAHKASISTTNTLLMSLLVYAGSSQLIAIGLFSAAAPPLSVILTTLVVNLRHLLMSAAVSPFLKGWRKLELAAFAYQLTDETFAVHTTRFSTLGPHKMEVFTINPTAQAAWLLGTWLGIRLGSLIHNTRLFALDYALPAMFIALLTLQIKHRVQVGVALLTGLLSVGLWVAGMDKWHVILATMIGASVGVLLEKWIKRPSS